MDRLQKELLLEGKDFPSCIKLYSKSLKTVFLYFNEIEYFFVTPVINSELGIRKFEASFICWHLGLENIDFLIDLPLSKTKILYISNNRINNIQIFPKLDLRSLEI